MSLGNLGGEVGVYTSGILVERLYKGNLLGELCVIVDGPSMLISEPRP